MNENSNINKELEELSPLLKKIREGNLKSQIPENYFKEVEDSIFFKTNRKGISFKKAFKILIPAASIIFILFFYNEFFTKKDDNVILSNNDIIYILNNDNQLFMSDIDTESMITENIDVEDIIEFDLFNSINIDENIENYLLDDENFEFYEIY